MHYILFSHKQYIIRNVFVLPLPLQVQVTRYLVHVNWFVVCMCFMFSAPLLRAQVTGDVIRVDSDAGSRALPHRPPVLPPWASPQHLLLDQATCEFLMPPQARQIRLCVI